MILAILAIGLGAPYFRCRLDLPERLYDLQLAQDIDVRPDSISAGKRL
jgi:hypothetical protein